MHGCVFYFPYNFHKRDVDMSVWNSVQKHHQRKGKLVGLSTLCFLSLLFLAVGFLMGAYQPHVVGQKV